MTEAGYPITQRGRFAIEATAFKLDVGNGFGYSNAVYAASTALSARARITKGLFADVRFATAGLASPGNLMGGVDYMFKIQSTGWITAGLGLGVPLARTLGSSSSIYYYGFLNAMWNAFEYAPNTMPLRLDFKFEQYIGGFGMRAELQPVVYFPVDVPNADPQLLFQHAVEVQYGHTFGGGLRLQGVANSFQQDGYQSAAELFVVMRRELGFARLGLLKTLDEDAGSPYRESWGMRFSGGIHLD